MCRVAAHLSAEDVGTNPQSRLSDDNNTTTTQDSLFLLLPETTQDSLFLLLPTSGLALGVAVSEL